MRTFAPKKSQKFLLLLLIFAIPLVSCVLDDEPLSPKDTDTIFSINIPVSPGTRALSEEDEYKIGTIDVIVFDHTTQRALYKVNSVNLISQTGNTGVPNLGRTKS